VLADHIGHRFGRGNDGGALAEEPTAVDGAKFAVQPIKLADAPASRTEQIHLDAGCL